MNTLSEVNKANCREVNMIDDEKEFYAHTDYEDLRRQWEQLFQWAHLSTICSAVCNASPYPCKQESHCCEGLAQFRTSRRSMNSIPTVFTPKWPLYSELGPQAHQQKQEGDGNAQHRQYHHMSSAVLRIDEIGCHPRRRRNGSHHGHLGCAAASTWSKAKLSLSIYWK